MFALVIEDMQLEEFIKGILSLGVLLVWYKLKFHAYIKFIDVLFAFLSMLIGILIVAFVRCIYSCISFWIENTEGLNFLIHMEDLELDRYPLSIFSKGMKLVLVSIIPVGLVSCFPAMFFLGKIENRLLYLLLEFGMSSFLLVVLCLIWKGGIKKYEATGG